jgi:phospholipase/carboxylesterase
MAFNIHERGPVLTYGAPLERAKAAMVMIHGRGATAESILSLAGEFDAQDFAYVAPQASGNEWYPYRFLEPPERNEPYLSSGLAKVGAVVAQVEAAGVPAEKIVLLGFSQGACLTLEYAARNAKCYGGLVALSGALIGPKDMPRSYSGSLSGTPVFLGCSDVDSHIPKDYVEASAETLRALGGEVTARLYRGMGHTVNADEIAAVREIMNQV